MTTLNEFVEKIYVDFFGEVQNEYGSRVDVKLSLAVYIEKKYTSLLCKIQDPKTKEFMLGEWYKSESKKLGYMNAKQKMGLILADDALVRINNNSSAIFKIALEKKTSGAVMQEKELYAQQLLQDMSKLIENVAEVNREIAQRELSESTIDVNYILGVSENYSIRMANQVRYEF